MYQRKAAKRNIDQLFVPQIHPVPRLERGVAWWLYFSKNRVLSLKAFKKLALENFQKAPVGGSRSVLIDIASHPSRTWKIYTAGA